MNYDEAIIFIIIMLNFIMFLGYYLFAANYGFVSLNNISFYICSVITYAVSFIILSFNIRIRSTIYTYINKFNVYNNIYNAIMFAFMILFMHCLYVNEVINWPHYPADYFRHSIAESLFFVLITIVVLIFNRLIYRKIGLSPHLRVYIILFVILTQVVFLYTPNPLSRNWMETYHLDAYTTSIINSFYLVPHDIYTASIYGHYSIVLIPIVKLINCLLGNLYLSVTLSICFIGLICWSLQYWMINKLINNDIVFVFTVLANLIVSTELIWYQNFQVLPHRIIFPTVILTYISWLIEHNYKNFKWLDFLLVTMSMLWNFETGLVCMFCINLFRLYLHCKDGYLSTNIINDILMVPFPFITSYCVVNIYNIFCHGSFINLSSFVYPLGSNFNFAKLELPLSVPFDWYFVMIISFLSLLAVYCKKVRKCLLDSYELTMVINSCIGLCVLCYSVNRYVNTNLVVAYFNFVLLLGYFCDKCTNYGLFSVTNLKRTTVYNQFAYLSLMLITIMSVSSVASFSSTLKFKLKTSYETKTLNQFISFLNSDIPTECVGFGETVPQLFALMNKNSVIFMADWPDVTNEEYPFMAKTNDGVVNREAINYLKNEISKSYKHILVHEGQVKYITEKYELNKVYKYNNRTYFLYSSL